MNKLPHVADKHLNFSTGVSKVILWWRIFERLAEDDVAVALTFDQVGEIWIELAEAGKLVDEFWLPRLREQHDAVTNEVGLGPQIQ